MHVKSVFMWKMCGNMVRPDAGVEILPKSVYKRGHERRKWMAYKNRHFMIIVISNWFICIDSFVKFWVLNICAANKYLFKFSLVIGGAYRLMLQFSSLFLATSCGAQKSLLTLPFWQCLGNQPVLEIKPGPLHAKHVLSMLSLLSGSKIES